MTICFHRMADLLVCKTDSGIPCELPLIYNGKYYDTCIDVDNGGVHWCYINTTEKRWKTCNMSTCPNAKGN